MECLVYNVTNEHFNNAAYVTDMRGVLAMIFNETLTADGARSGLR